MIARDDARRRAEAPAMAAAEGVIGSDAAPARAAICLPDPVTELPVRPEWVPHLRGQ